ncbi:L-type lectin-domain containing receptor kinase IX [Spatholobus suberectus]|nr:L-type lectin-domain containing receptor kinase IX [Spatholobus suberectus]
MLGPPYTLVLFLHTTFTFFFFFFSLSHSLFFNITNFDDPATSTAISYQGDGRASNGSMDLNKKCLYNNAE